MHVWKHQLLILRRNSPSTLELSKSPELQNLVKAMPVSMRPNNNNAVGHRPVSPTLKSYDDRQAPPGRHRRVSMRPKYSKQAPPERYYRIPMGQYQIIYRSLNGEDKIVSTKELLPKVIQILSWSYGSHWGHCPFETNCKASFLPQEHQTRSPESCECLRGMNYIVIQLDHELLT